ncbi:MAG: hypothetical protein ACLU9S_06285 [Oscillospiraceae bacterium]
MAGSPSPHPPGPFVQVSREKIRVAVERELQEFHVTPTPETVSRVVEERLREEIRRGVQTIQYQVVTLMTTNGQAPLHHRVHVSERGQK